MRANIFFLFSTLLLILSGCIETNKPTNLYLIKPVPFHEFLAVVPDLTNRNYPDTNITADFLKYFSVRSETDMDYFWYFWRDYFKTAEYEELAQYAQMYEDPVLGGFDFGMKQYLSYKYESLCQYLPVNEDTLTRVSKNRFRDQYRTNREFSDTFNERFFFYIPKLFSYLSSVSKINRPYIDEISVKLSNMSVIYKTLNPALDYYSMLYTNLIAYKESIHPEDFENANKFILLNFFMIKNLENNSLSQNQRFQILSNTFSFISRMGTIKTTFFITNEDLSIADYSRNLEVIRNVYQYFDKDQKFRVNNGEYLHLFFRNYREMSILDWIKLYNN